MSEQRGDAGVGYAALSYMLGGPLLYGGLGWVADHHLGTMFLTPVGVVLGLVLSVLVIYKRYGATDESAGSTN